MGTKRTFLSLNNSHKLIQALKMSVTEKGFTLKTSWAYIEEAKWQVAAMQLHSGQVSQQLSQSIVSDNRLYMYGQ